MRFIIKIIFTTCAIMLTAYLLEPHFFVEDLVTGIIAALVLSLLNTILRPILLFISIPATVLTLGLFIFVVNTVIIYLVTKIVPGFTVENFWWALLCSVIISIVSSILNSFIKKDENQKQIKQ